MELIEYACHNCTRTGLKLWKPVEWDQYTSVLYCAQCLAAKHLLTDHLVDNDGFWTPIESDEDGKRISQTKIAGYEPAVPNLDWELFVPLTEWLSRHNVWWGKLPIMSATYYKRGELIVLAKYNGTESWKELIHRLDLDDSLPASDSWNTDSTASYDLDETEGLA